MIFYTPGMLFALYLFRPRGRAARVEDTETQEAAGPALAGDMGDNARCAGVEETAPSRPEENEKEAEAKKSAPEEGEEEAAPAPVE